MQSGTTDLSRQDSQHKNIFFIFIYSLHKNQSQMKKTSLFFSFMSIGITLFLTACSPVTMTSWTNPQDNQIKIKTIVVWAMFEKLQYEQPFEDAIVSYLKGKGIKAIPALSILTPGVKYELPVLEKKFDSIGATSALIIAYKGTDKTQTYVPPTTTTVYGAYPGYYGNYYGFYNYAYPVWGANTVTTGGYWETSTTVSLVANLYGTSKETLIWTGDITYANPSSVSGAGFDVAKSIYTSWSNANFVK